MKKRWMLFLFMMIFWLGTIQAVAATIMPTDVQTPSENCMFLGLEGKYVVQIQSALDRVNKIRYEACQEGVINPSTDKPLTPADYVPIRWSSDLEYIARIRAAEASVTMDHTRTNGADCFAIQSPNGVSSWGEVLAWNWSDSMVVGIEQWYGEKQDWVDQNPNAVTGHYTQMIDPENLYIGMGTFCTEKAYYYNTTAGEFSSYSGLNESRGTGIDACIQKLEVSNRFLNGRYTVSGTSKGKAGDLAALHLTASISINDYWGNSLTTDGLLVLSPVTWNSADPKIALVNSDGTVRANYCGQTYITARDTAGHEGRILFTVGHTEAEDAAVPATCTQTGLSKGTHCSVCGEVITAPKTTPVTAHKWDSGKVTKQATVKSTGKIVYTCLTCGKTKTGKIAKVKIVKGKTYTVGKLKYKITVAKTNGKGTVALTGTTEKKQNVKSLKVPDTVKIGGVKFSVTEIAAKSFRNCTALKSVSVGKNVESIGKEAFYNCKKLSKLTIKSKKLKSVKTNAIKSIYRKAVIQVPSSKLKAYKSLFKSTVGFKKTMKIKK